MVDKATQKNLTEWADNQGVLGGTTAQQALTASGISTVALTTTTQELPANSFLIQLTTTGNGVCTLPPAQNVGHIVNLQRVNADGGTMKITVTGTGATAGVAPLANQGNASTSNIVLTLVDAVCAGSTLMWLGDGQGWMEIANYSTTVNTAGGAWDTS